MGTIKQGILGGFSGKVGTVIGSSWKGISYMRGQAQHVKNPRSSGQMDQRTKFNLVLNFLQPNVPYIRIGYKSQAAKQTEFNAAMSYHCIVAGGTDGHLLALPCDLSDYQDSKPWSYFLQAAAYRLGRQGVLLL